MAVHRVAFVLPSFDAGGSQRVLLNLLSNLDRARFEGILIVFSRHGPLQPPSPDIPLLDLGRPRLREAVPALFAALRRVRPHAVFSTLGYVNLAVLAMRPLLPNRLRVVVRESNTPSVSLPTLAHAGLLRTGYRVLYPRADRIICQSALIARELERDFGVRRERLLQLPNPVDVTRLRSLASIPDRVPGPGKRFVGAGYLIPQKGFDRLLDLFVQMPPEDHLTILGEGVDRKALTEKIARLNLAGRVLLPGHAATPWAAFAGADAFLLPSRWEGMPNVALEALACGTPVIATPESGGLPEVVREAMPGAITIAPFGDAFLAAMRRVAVDPVDTPRASLLPEAFSIDRVSASFADILAG